MPCNRTPGAGPYVTGAAFANWAHNVTLTPHRIYSPATVDELVGIVKDAEANGASVRAVGSGWSFTDVMLTPDYLVYTDNLDALLSETISGTDYPDDPVFGALTSAAKGRLLCHVHAGIKIHDLHDALESRSGNGFSNLPPVRLNDGPGGSPQDHGYALKTLGGSGGQSIVGAISTSTHGGDDHDAAGGSIPPLPDMVHGIHLVTTGGTEFFIQRGGQRAIADAAMLAELMPCVAGRIISDDDAFNATIVSMGRMGLIYSVVLEVQEQYVLRENLSQDTWNNVRSGGMLNSLRASHRFVEVLILPYANSDGDHTCFVTTRDQVQPTGPPFGAPGFSAFNFACEQPGVLAVTIAGIIGGLASSIAALLAIPIIGPVLAAADIALMAVLVPLLDPNVTIGDYLAAAVNIATNLGQLDFGEWLVNTILSSAQSPNVRQDLSYKVMDTYDYSADCYKALSLEVAFDAEGSAYLDYIQRLFDLINNFAAENILVGAYISLRFCAGSAALLAIEQWPHTVCIEISALAGLAGEVDVLAQFEAEAASRGATVHWGQLNSRSRADVEAAFPGKIDRWRATLARLTRGGSLATFDNDFCQSHGLEVVGRTSVPGSDTSYLVPLLLDEPPGSTARAGADMPYLLPLLLAD